MEAYKTIQGTAQARIEEKKSEFIAHAAFADTEEKALAFLNGIRAKHRTANHNVYAYILRDGARMRYSDDGEPAKTSGLPTLEAIRHAGLVDCIVSPLRHSSCRERDQKQVRFSRSVMSRLSAFIYATVSTFFV